MKALLTIEEAAELTKLSVKTLYTYAEKEKIPHIKLGRRVLFEENKLEEWVSSQRVEPTNETEKITASENNTTEDGFENDTGGSA